MQKRRLNTYHLEKNGPINPKMWRLKLNKLSNVRGLIALDFEENQF